MINALTIAGTDPTGGAGIQADLKTFSALGVYGMSIITALVSQNTQGVDSILPISSNFIAKQFASVVNDVKVDVLKIGALINENIVNTVAELIQESDIPLVVLDTVMIAKSGHALLDSNAINSIREKMLPLATIITPNIPEAAALLNSNEATTEEEMVSQGKALLEFGCGAVLIKGGHLNSEESPDFLVTPKGVYRFVSKRVKTKNTHGTGCTLSAAVAAFLPKHNSVDAVKHAKKYLTGALENADRLNVGQGYGPTHHFYKWW